MKSSDMLLCAFASLFLSLQAGTVQPADQKVPHGLPGAWQGVLDVGTGKLRLVFNISAGTDGMFSATLDSPDQGATGIPVSSATLRGDSLFMDAKVIMGRFEGKIESGDSVISGVWKQSGYTFPLTLKRSVALPEMRRPQEPRKPYPYDEEEVRYDNPKGGVTLAGTLTLPRVGQPLPAVILISGSGAQNRDELVFNHRPFLVLADHLSRAGIAVLRVDDRGVGGSTGNIGQSTTEDLAGDVLSGITCLKCRKEIDPKRIGLLGHSEGGLVGPLVASQSRDVAFLVLMAGPGLPGEQILYLQSALIARSSGASDEDIARARRRSEHIYGLLKTGKDSSALAPEVSRIIRDALLEQVGGDSAAVRESDALVQAQLKVVFSPWFRFFLTYDPRPALQTVHCPVLSIIGEKDLQVPPRENLPEIEKALREGGTADFVVREMPGLNHLFQTATTGSVTEYAVIEETISPAALDLITNWIRQKSGIQ